MTNLKLEGANWSFPSLFNNGTEKGLFLILDPIHSFF